MPADPAAVTDCLTKHAFDDYTLPEPHFEGGSPVLSAGFGNIGSAEMPSEVDERWLKGAEVEETVPITWEAAL